MLTTVFFLWDGVRLSPLGTSVTHWPISDGAIIKCNYELCVKVVNKSNIKPKTPSTVMHMTILSENIWLFYGLKQGERLRYKNLHKIISGILQHI
jgi:hypothetical protein